MFGSGQIVAGEITTEITAKKIVNIAPTEAAAGGTILRTSFVRLFVSATRL